MGIIEKPIAKVLMLKGEKGEQGDVNLSQLNKEKNARISSDNNLQSQIDSLANGSPLVASSTSGMTDTSKVYVNTTDGNWYYYNGSSWVIGGTYQATGIGENSVSIGNITNLQKNKLYETVTQNDVAFDHTTIYNGVDNVDNKAISSPFIYMIKGSVITFNNSPKVRITRYNDNKEFVSSTGSYVVMNSYTIPADGYYRIGLTSTDDTGFQLVDALTLVEFVGYREKADNYNDGINYQIGTIDQSGNVKPADNNNRIVSDMFKIAKGSIIKIYDSYIRFRIAIDKYDIDGKYISSVQWGRDTFVADQDYNIRVRITYTDSRTITNDDINILKNILLIQRAIPEVNVPLNKIYECSAHRGCVDIGIPENTILAYKYAKAHNFDSFETDVRMTSDHIPVICHDETINYIARNTDGTTIAEDVYVANSTYDELSQYDYGIYCGSQYAGTPLLTFDEVVKFAKFYNININIDCKETAESDLDIIYNVVRKYGMQYNVRWTCQNISVISYLLSKNNKIQASWTMYPNNSRLDELKALATSNPQAELFVQCNVNLLSREDADKVQARDIKLSCYCETDSAIVTAVGYGATALTINNYLPYGLLERSFDNL